MIDAGPGWVTTGMTCGSVWVTVTTMTDALERLLEAARRAKPSAEQREEQRRSFAYGNTAFENDLITREMIDREAEKLVKERNEKPKS